VPLAAANGLDLLWLVGGPVPMTHRVPGFEPTSFTGVGAIGMRFTGGFALALAVEPPVLAPVLVVAEQGGHGPGRRESRLERPSRPPGVTA
jgi:hypothetical protein